MTSNNLTPHYLRTEKLIMEVLYLDAALISDEATLSITDSIKSGEYGLAYDVFAFEFDEGNYIPSPPARIHLNAIATSFGIMFPEKSS